MRSTVSCKGTVCPHGNLDTFALAWEIDKHHNDAATLPHKFKVAIAGCASTCSKPQLNDVGLVGVSVPHLTPESCIGCGLCVEACHLDAVKLLGGLPVIDPNRCVACGDCSKACPAAALNPEQTGLDLYAGGRWGRVKQVGIKIARLLDTEEAVRAVGSLKKWYADNGGKKERLGQTMVRVGLEKFFKEVQADIPAEKRLPLTEENKAAFSAFR